MTDRRAQPAAIVLGAAAGGGFPQWNCGCRLCSLARAGDPDVVPATQASVAVSGDGDSWVLIGASPDIRQQILSTPALSPRVAGRHSPISGVVLTGGDIDAIAGLLTLRERQAFTLYAPRELLNVVNSNAVFSVLDPGFVRQREAAVLEPVDCGGGLVLTLLPMPGKVPLYQESRNAMEPEPGLTYAALLQAGGRKLIVAPACAEITDAVHAQLAQADVVFFDGTLFTDDEMITAGLSTKSSRRMGHVPISGSGGTLARLGNLPGRRILFHINNSNPILLRSSAERRAVEAAGFEVAYDGMEVPL